MAVTYSNSPKVVYTKLSPNRTSPRTHSTYNPTGKITKITIHHMAGNLSIETCGNVFAPSSAQASSNYGIGSDGRVGMYVEEKNRSWCSSNAANDHKAVTIEVANSSTGGNWPVSDKAFNSLVSLCVDICKRNGIPKLVYDGTANGTLTRHNMFTATTCPGPYLQDRFASIASQVNAQLSGGTGGGTGGGTSVSEYQVRVIVSELNVRSGPGTNYAINTTIRDKGTYTIVAHNADGTWGQLKSGAGWICITSQYVEKVGGSSGSGSALKTGDQVKLTNAPVYASATATTKSSDKTGTFWIYEGTQTNGRIRITNDKSNVGKTPSGSYVTGWARASDCKK